MLGLFRSTWARLVLAIAVIGLYLRRKLKRYLEKNFHSIPLPAMEDYMENKDSLILQLVGASALAPAAKIAAYEKMGKPVMFKLRLGFLPQVVSCDKQDITIASTKLKACTFALYRPFLGYNSILFQEGEKARKERTLLNRGFGQQTYRSIHPVMIASAERLRDRMVKETEMKGSFEAEQLVSRATLEVIAEGGFSFDAQKDENLPYLNALKKMLRIPGHPICLLPGGTAFVEWLNKDSINLVKDLLDKTITKRLEEPESAEKSVRDLLDLVIASSKQVDSSEDSLDISWIRDQVQLLFIGGSDTSSITLHTGFILLAHYKEIQVKVKEEIRLVFSNNTESFFDKVSQLVYTEAFIKEVLRLYPPFTTITRRLNDDETEFRGVPVNDRPNTLLSYDFQLSHRREVYFPEPNKFIPERWLDGRVDAESYGSFSHGFRACLGKNFAMTEMKTILATVLMNHTIMTAREDQEGKLPAWGLVGQAVGPIGEWPLRLIPDSAK